MGMSSSQARLLSLTGRMHDIEYKAQNLEAQKLQMANESDSVYKEYENALNATKIQLKQISNDGSITYIDATYQNMLDSGYQIKIEGIDKIIVSQATANNFVAAGGNKNYFTALETGRVTTTNQNVGGVTEIYTAEQLMNMSANGNYRLMSDIDLTGKNFTSLNLNGGNFDGNGYTIKGLDKALFSSVSNSTISNLNIEGDATSNGLLANTVRNNSNINNIKACGSVSNTSNTGGLIGVVEGSSIVIDKCDVNVNVDGYGTNKGGLIGWTSGDIIITNCSSKGKVNGEAVLGGFIGSCNGTNISNCSSDSSVSLKGDPFTGNISIDSGGFIGVSTNTTINNSLSKGSIENNRGGVQASHTLGGFIGAMHSTNIDHCDSYVDVYSKTDWIGGFIGWIGESTSNISNSNSFGNTSTETNDTCGFINEVGGGIVNNCYTLDKENPFSKNEANVTNTSSTPIDNNIVVTPPSIKQTTKINNAGSEEAAALFDEMQKNGYLIEGQDINNPVLGNENDSNWFTNMVNLGFLSLFKKDSITGEFYQTNVATDTNLQEVSNEIDLKKAETKYEADMRKINAKDKKFDTDLAALESERNAIKTEIDTLKTVIKDNVDMTFKLFS